MSKAVTPLLLMLTATALAAQHPPKGAKAWWRTTTALASDSMQGRDTGSAAYEQAARYVADRLQHAGLLPAGDNGTFFQRVPMHQVDLDLNRSALTLTAPNRPAVTLALLQQVTLTPPATGLDLHRSAPLIFLGYGDHLPDPATLGLPDLHTAVAVFFSATPATARSEDARTAFLAQRAATLAAGGFALTLAIDNPAATEPTHWPAAYSRSVTLAGLSLPAPSTTTLRISAEAAAQLFTNIPTALYPALLQASEAGSPLPAFSLNTELNATLHTTEKDIASPNILALLPGADPAIAPEVVAVSAHLDGYGLGTPVNGDNLYNGALDDAAYVATLLELADTWSRTPLAQRPHRSVLFAIFTGEEKGLLGSLWFTDHPTLPLTRIVADLNLDQLRPLFPLRSLTMEGLADSSLGPLAQQVASSYNIELRPDREPERNLFRRADNFNFVRAGIPIASFLFGYDPGTPEERTYRDWYARRYHKPQDDLSTPIDWTAAVTFNNFFRDLTLAVADAPIRPQWSPTSPWRPRTGSPASQIQDHTSSAPSPPPAIP